MKTAWLPADALPRCWAIRTLCSTASLPARSHVPLGRLCRMESGQYADEYVDCPGEADSARVYLRVDNVRPFVANLNPCDLAHVHAGHPAVSRRALVCRGDVLIARTGTLGKAALSGDDVAGAVLSQHLTRLTVLPEYAAEIPPTLLCAFLNSPAGRRQLLAAGAGSTRLELTHERLAEIRMPRVDRAGRAVLARRVARGCAHLAAAGACIRQAVKLYDACFPSPPSGLRARVQWGHQAADLLGPRWTPRSHLASHPVAAAGYELAPLDSLADVVRGKGTRRADYAAAGLPFIRTSSLINGGIDPFPDHRAAPETYERFGQPTQEGDLLLSIEGKIGAVAYLTGMDCCVFKNHIERIRAHRRGDAADVFLALASRFGQEQLRRLTVVQATLPGLARRSREVLVPIVRGGQRLPGHAAARRLLARGLRYRRLALGHLAAAATLADELFPG